ncbi:hypothetical protein [uncultured Alistipes sp.]|uniref:hypothetical protein n=1 Tax=uncultured Alistipes sp. TaxID=538949 RepID=UPI002611F328|nr:hypothetical protein [uncultured Alistipes sp.]
MPSNDCFRPCRRVSALFRAGGAFGLLTAGFPEKQPFLGCEKFSVRRKSKNLQIFPPYEFFIDNTLPDMKTDVLTGRFRQFEIKREDRPFSVEFNVLRADEFCCPKISEYEKMCYIAL